MLILTHQQQTAFENMVGKEEISRDEQFLLFPHCFLLNQKIVSPFVNIHDIISLFAAELEKPKIGMSDKGLYLFKKKKTTILNTFKLFSILMSLTWTALKFFSVVKG